MHLPPSIVIFRRDLRLGDNWALNAALSRRGPVICVYIREPNDPFAGALGAAQAWWLHHSLQTLTDALGKRKNELILFTGNTLSVITRLVKQYGCGAVFWNRRYNGDGVESDSELKSVLRSMGIDAESFPGFLLHEPSKLLTGESRRYSVYTPFWRALNSRGQILDPLSAPDLIPCLDECIESEELASWDLLPKHPDWAAEFSKDWTPGEDSAHSALRSFMETSLYNYKKNRDFPGIGATSRLSPHLTIGEISPHAIWRATENVADDVPTDDLIHFRKELVWREFSWHLLFHQPDLPKQNLNLKFNRFSWLSDPEKLECWKRGLTGYPIVDAGMRELWQTGYMHNRVRMIVASFLIKDLMIDWREGEKWFRHTLLDADEANNAASWQWVAGSGADASPFFRIFNPTRQGETFDADGEYVRRFCPELKKLPDRFIHKPFEAPGELLASSEITLGKSYPYPIVNHDVARKVVLQAFAEMNLSQD